MHTCYDGGKQMNRIQSGSLDVQKKSLLKSNLKGFCCLGWTRTDSFEDLDYE